MRSLPLLGIAVVVAAQALACRSPQGLVLLDVTSTVEFTDVRLTVRANDALEVSYDHVDLHEQTPFQIGVYLPSDVHGSITLKGEVREGDCLRGTGTQTALGISSGKTSDVFGLVIAPGAADLCMPGAGGHGGEVGGAAGSSGPGGSGGQEPAAGGAGGETSPGQGGSPGEGGASGGGQGGGLGGGTGGRAGRGGIGGRGGAGGVAGGAGPGGMSGKAGTPGDGGSVGGAGGQVSPPPPSIQIVAQCQTETRNTIGIRFKILNPSNVSIPLSSITARYLYTLNDPTLPVIDFDYLQSVPPPAITTVVSTDYVDFGFTAAAGTLQAFDTVTGSGEIQLRIHPPMYLPTGWNLSQTDDPSFKGCTGSAYEPRPTFLGFVNGSQAWPAQ
jgi:hypothetical protein